MPMDTDTDSVSVLAMDEFVASAMRMTSRPIVATEEEVRRKAMMQ